MAKFHEAWLITKFHNFWPIFHVPFTFPQPFSFSRFSSLRGNPVIPLFWYLFWFIWQCFPETKQNHKLSIFKLYFLISLHFYLSQRNRFPSGEGNDFSIESKNQAWKSQSAHETLYNIKASRLITTTRGQKAMLSASSQWAPPKSDYICHYSDCSDIIVTCWEVPLRFHCLAWSETLYWRDDALSTKPVMHYQGTAYLCY